MRTKSSSLILLIALLSSVAEAGALAGQITFEPSPPPRNQQGQGQQAQGQQGQGQQQGQPKQQGLPPEKKKSLSKYGPEDVFPGAREQDDSQRPPRRSSRQSATASRKPTPAPPAANIPTPILAVASPTPPPSIPAAATPVTSPGATGATGATATSNRPAQPPANNPSSSSFVPIALGSASLLVFGALIYVVGVLRKKLREGR